MTAPTFDLPARAAKAKALDVADVGARHGPEAVRAIFDAEGEPMGDMEEPVTRPASPKLGRTLAPALERIARRCSGREKPIALPWPTLAPHFGGGLWPGLHILNKGTGVGGTQLGLQIVTHAAKAGVPGLYIGLELGELDLALRCLGLEAGVPWSHLWTGTAGPAHVARIAAAAPALHDLPIHFEVAKPHGFAPSEIRAAVEAMRASYPETDGPGSRPVLVAVDFLQLVGDEPGDEQELRIRIGRASYVLRELANRLGVAVLCISSVARERYKLLNELHTAAGLAWATDPSGYPTERRILNTDAIVGSGKESGELEFAADSVSVIARVPETWNGGECDMIIATAKGRATGAMWSPLHFDGYAYRECEDRGGRMLDAWKEAGDRRARAREEKRSAKDDAKADALTRDVAAIRSFVAVHPGCTVREARVATVKDNARRWTPALALLTGSGEVVQSEGGPGRKRGLYLAPRSEGGA